VRLVNVAFATHEGRVRTENEDSVFVDGKKTPVVAILADGMGGHAGGKQASSLTIKYIRKKLKELGNLSQVTKERLGELIEEASEHLRAEAEKDERMRGMGTTLVLALIDTGSAKIASIGDSRAYCLSKGEITQITKDHSYVQYLYDHNLMTREEMRTHPYKNIIMRAVGMENADADVYEIELKRGDTILLCSDGLTGELEDAEIAEVLSQRISAKKKVNELIDRALSYGGRDNISVAIVENKGIVGEILQDKYEVQELIAEGGMSRVYKGICTKTGKDVAIKMFKTEFMEIPQAVEGFKQEAKASAMLHHPNLMHAIDVGKIGKFRYIVSDYVPGTELKSMLGELTLEQSVDIVKKVLAGIGYAHNRGVVHQDLKPNNILMDGDRPVIIDFGIARMPEQTTPADCVLATVDYFSPEQAMNDHVDARSDIYSIGVMLYEMCTGKLPFEGTDEIQIALKHMHQPVTPPNELNPEIPESLSRVIMKAMEKKPQDRYPNAAAMRRDLEQVFEQPDGEYVTISHAAVQKAPKSKTLPLLITIGVISVAMIAAVIMLINYVSAVQKDRNAEAETVYMPYLLDKNEEQALELLEGYDVKIEYGVVLEAEDGSIIEQSPEAGTVIDEGDSVSIMVNEKQEQGDG